MWEKAPTEGKTYRLFVDDGVVVGAVGLLLVVEPVLPHRDDALRLDGGTNGPTNSAPSTGSSPDKYSNVRPLLGTRLTQRPGPLDRWIDVNEYFVVNRCISKA